MAPDASSAQLDALLQPRMELLYGSSGDAVLVPSRGEQLPPLVQVRDSLMVQRPRSSFLSNDSCLEGSADTMQMYLPVAVSLAPCTQNPPSLLSSPHRSTCSRRWAARAAARLCWRRCGRPTWHTTQTRRRRRGRARAEAPCWRKWVSGGSVCVWGGGRVGVLHHSHACWVGGRSMRCAW